VINRRGWVKKRLKINGMVMFLATLVLVAFPMLFFRTDQAGSQDNFIEIFGIAFVLLGQLIRVSARGFKAQNSENGNNLIQDGPYSMVRNPMYLGIFLISLGVVLLLFKWWVFFIFVVFFIIRYMLLIKSEEKKLKVLFTEAYASYCKKVTHRIFPSLNLLLEREICEYLPLKLKWIKKEIGSILGVLFLVILLESWEDIAAGGIRAYFKEAVGMLGVIVLFISLVSYLNYYTVKKDASVKS
jgi:protein-S-isoprenylcysteine O-methyltransferase Ste14